MQRPALAIRRDAMERYLRCFDEKCGKSKEIITDARQYIPAACSIISPSTTHSPL